MEKQSLLDFLLVPGGLLALVAYHIWLLRQVINHPTTTVIGINSINRRLWVHAMMDHDHDLSRNNNNGVLAVQTLRNNIMASTLLASTAIMLSSVIAVLMTHSTGGYRPSSTLFFGDTGDRMLTIKFFFILVCFIVTFLLNVQSIRYYNHVGILINVPCKNINLNHWTKAEYVGRTLNRGSYFWSLGLRSFYFTLPLFLWVFGPIPMFISSLSLLSLLYFLDVTTPPEIQSSAAAA
ncbi:uncharacterized protein LOC124929020 [Impatiens glandulifera]|uniref:uncharacterized protein LOC124929020 n=1 Tax=Impatiens glandulifera TaxID=253017 RepID=UPI001FB0DDE8|nr:uncharacterized protein LOC124929020 [Impatiens glandulifera]